MRLRLTIRTTGVPKAETHELESGFVVLGRKNANINLEDSRCSQQHVLLYQGPDGALWAKDLDSTNGTFVGGQQITETQLNEGDEFKIGKSTVLIEEYSPAESKKVGPRTSPKSDETTQENTGGARKPKKPVTDPALVTSWPQNMQAAPKSFQDKFVDYVDEKGTRTRVQLKDMLKKAS